MPEPHERLANLFQGRTDCYGLVHGESVKATLVEACWYNHVYGKFSVGVYPLLDDGTCHWGCIDIDEGYENLNIAVNVWKVLKALGITSWVERTKGKGYHVWILCDSWVPAEDMRRAQFLACQVAGYHPKEVNPKQSSLAPGQVGNYVNVCWAHDWVAEGKRVIVYPEVNNGRWSLETWLSVAEQTLTPPAVIAKAALLYKAPQAARSVAWDHNPSLPIADLTRRLRGVTRVLFEEGPLPSLTTGRIDRSAALQRLAHLLYNDAFSASEALKLVEAMDQNLEKYTGRADAELQYQRIVEKAFQ